MQLFIEQLLNGIATGSIYALVTLGLALVYGIMRILHVAHAAVFTIGAYVGLLFFDLTGSLFLAVLGSMAVCALVGVAIERFVSKIKEVSPDVIFSSGYYFQTGPVLKQARELGMKSQIIGEEGADSPKTVEIAGEAAEGFVIVTNLNRDDKRPFVQEFLKEYESRFKIQPDMVDASAYDAFMVICDGIKRAKSTTGKAMRDAIAATKDYDGLTGVIKGFHKGEVVKEVQVQQVKGGRFRYLGVITDPALITP